MGTVGHHEGIVLSVLAQSRLQTPQGHQEQQNGYQHGISDTFESEGLKPTHAIYGEGVNHYLKPQRQIEERSSFPV